MTKRLMILLAISSLSLGSLNGCTSKESKDDAEVATDAPAADAGPTGDGLEALDGKAGPPAAGTAEALPEDSLDGALSDTSPAPEAPAPTTPGADLSAQTSEPALDLPADPAAEPSMDAPSQSEGIADIEAPAKKESKTISEPSSTDTPPAPTASASLQKVPEKPWTQGGILLNTVYFARPGDTVSSVSQMIYGADKTAELKKANPKLKHRDPKPSEKIFYNSPQRVADSEKMLNYYEDNGVQAQTYVAQEGDTIQKVGKTLLGYDQAWKEIWPVNSVESKGQLTAGTELRYWKAAKLAPAAAPAPEIPVVKEELPPPPGDMAANQLPPPPDMAAGAEANAMPPPPGDMAANQPPPPPDMAAAPPPPPPAMDQANAMNDLPAPPPPPPPVEKKAPPAGAKAVDGMDEETMIALGGIAVAALGLTFIMVVKRKRRQRELEAAFNETQVGT